jgi:hypothetical protein
MRSLRIAVCFLALWSAGLSGCAGWFTPEDEIAPQTLQDALVMKYGEGFAPRLAEPDIEQFVGEDVVNVRWEGDKLVWTLPPIFTQVTNDGGVTIPPITGNPVVDVAAMLAGLAGLIAGGSKLDQKRRKRKTAKAAEAVK